MSLIDLSHPIGIGTVGFPTCSKIVGWPLKEISWSSYNMLHISMDLHTGTHMDAMRHCVPNGDDITALPLEHCVGPAAVVDLTSKGEPGCEFEPHDFEPAAHRIRECGKVLIKTGWARHWGTPQYHDRFPGFTRAAAEYLVDLGIHLVGVEQASIHPTDHLVVHRIFFDRRAIIVEGLANLTAVEAEVVDFTAAPLRFQEADGSPVRAFCRVPEEASR